MSRKRKGEVFFRVFLFTRKKINIEDPDPSGVNSKVLSKNPISRLPFSCKSLIEELLIEVYALRVNRFGVRTVRQVEDVDQVPCVFVVMVCADYNVRMLIHLGKHWLGQAGTGMRSFRTRNSLWVT